MRPGSALAAAFAVVALSVAVAQSTHPFVGKWKVSWEGKKGFYEASLELAESGGTWRTFAANKYDPCVGRQVPVNIRESGLTSIAVVLAFSEGLHGCRDSTVTIQRVDENTASGTRGAATLRLIRE